MRHTLKEEENSPDIFLLVRGLGASEKSYYKKMFKRHANQNTALHLKLFKLFYNKKPVFLSVAGFAAIFSLWLFAIEEADSLISRISEKSKCP